jgi:hypothetical protein
MHKCFDLPRYKEEAKVGADTRGAFLVKTAFQTASNFTDFASRGFSIYLDLQIISFHLLEMEAKGWCLVFIPKT